MPADSNTIQGPIESRVVHLHGGRCGPSLLDVEHDLNDLVDGTSATLLKGVSIASLLKGTFAINSHSIRDTSVSTACGNIVPSPAVGAESFTLILSPENNSAQLGQATLTSRGADTEVLLSISSDPDEYYNVGISLLEQGSWKDAIAYFDQAIRHNNKFADAYNKRGRSYHGLVRYQRAIQDYNDAIRLDPLLSKVYSNKAAAVRGQEDRGLSTRATAGIIVGVIAALLVLGGFGLVVFRRR